MLTAKGQGSAYRKWITMGGPQIVFVIFRLECQ